MRSWKLGHKSIQKCYLYKQRTTHSLACSMSYVNKKKLINKDGFSTTMIRANWL